MLLNDGGMCERKCAQWPRLVRVLGAMSPACLRSTVNLLLASSWHLLSCTGAPADNSGTAVAGRVPAGFETRPGLIDVSASFISSFSSRDLIDLPAASRYRVLAARVGVGVGVGFGVTPVHLSLWRSQHDRHKWPMNAAWRS